MAWKSGQSYSSDLRSRVLAAIDGGGPAKAVAQLFQVSVSYIYKALGRRAATGETEARPQRNRQTLKLAEHHAAIAAEVALRPDVTLDELRAWLLATHQVEASLGLMHKTLARLGLTRKKSRGGREEQDRPDVAERRADWRAGQGALSPARLVFVERPVPPPTWRGATAAARAASACDGPVCRTATGRAPPSSAASPRAASSPPTSSTAP